MKITLLCLLLAVAPAASAQNKCIDANGRITYQQDLCPGGVAPAPAQPAAEPPPMEPIRITPQARPAPPPAISPQRCEQMARELAQMRGALGSFPAPQRANIERQLVADERTYKQECK